MAETREPRKAEVRIGAVGVHVPAHREANRPRLAELTVNEDLIDNKLGIEYRAVKAPSQSIVDLCISAYADLCAHGVIELSAIQLCCVVTQNPDQPVPHVSALLHHQLGLAKSCLTFDISQACAGYVYGLTLATALMERLGLEQALLFTCDPYSKIVDPTDRNTALIFGDAATVTHLTRAGAGYAFIDGDYGTVPGSSACLRTEGEPPTLHMDGIAVLMNAVREVPGSIRTVLARHTWSLTDVDLVLLHPGSLRVVDLLRRKLDLSEDKAPFEIARIGNTVSSSIPLSLQRHIREPRHNRIVMSGFGVGFSWATCVLERRSGT